MSNLSPEAERKEVVTPGDPVSEPWQRSDLYGVSEVGVWAIVGDVPPVAACQGRPRVSCSREPR